MDNKKLNQKKEYHMTLHNFKRIGAVALVTLSMAGVSQAQEAEGNIRVGDKETKARIALPENDKDSSRITATTDRDLTARTAVGKVNKATSLTGMAVRNMQNEKLGDIKDIVLDLSSGKISYVVLSVGGFLGIGDKLIAVPPSAFNASADDTLVLDADKAKIQAAPGFVQTAWPDVNDPQFTAYWKTDRDAIGGSSTTTETGRSRSLDQDVDRKNSDLNRKN
jgi:sporulation protein YlmC with PRC-barrel domain